MNRFDYVKYDEKAVKQQAEFKAKFCDLETLFVKSQRTHEEIMRLVGLMEPGRAKDLAVSKIGKLFSNSDVVMTAMEEGYMWIGKAIRDEQFARTGNAPLQEERSDS